MRKTSKASFPNEHGIFSSGFAQELLMLAVIAVAIICKVFYSFAANIPLSL